MSLTRPDVLKKISDHYDEAAPTLPAHRLRRPVPNCVECIILAKELNQAPEAVEITDEGRIITRIPGLGRRRDRKI